jgi:hypothetical protein
MRTTVTLDSDVEQPLQQVIRERGVSFKQALNESIRAGVATPKRAARKFVQPTFRMGAEPYFRWDKALSVAAAMEDEELVRKIALGK